MIKILGIPLVFETGFLSVTVPTVLELCRPGWP